MAEKRSATPHNNFLAKKAAQFAEDEDILDLGIGDQLDEYIVDNINDEDELAISEWYEAGYYRGDDILKVRDIEIKHEFDEDLGVHFVSYHKAIRSRDGKASLNHCFHRVSVSF